jgi:hypothetical protein
MDINLWQHFSDNQHFAQFVPNLFGKIFRWSFLAKQLSRKKSPHFSRGIFRTQGYQCQGKILDVASRVFLLIPCFCCVVL